MLAAVQSLPRPGATGSVAPAAGPEQLLRPGSTVAIGCGPGATSLLLTLLAAVTGDDSWAAVIGVPDLGLEAAAELGADLRRIALVPDPGPSWLEVTAALLDSLSVVVLRPPGRCRPADTRRLAARARKRGSVLLIFPETAAHSADLSWPESPDVLFQPVFSSWRGLGAGHGRLREHWLKVVASGRRLAGPSRSFRLAAHPDGGGPA